jgi:hypothetical protein
MTPKLDTSKLYRPQATVHARFYLIATAACAIVLSVSLVIVVLALGAARLSHPAVAIMAACAAALPASAKWTYRFFRRWQHWALRS